MGDNVFAHGLEGDFVLPKHKTKGLVFIAGGIGITPFRSMVKYLLDTGEARDITLIYAVDEPNDLVLMDIFNEAKEAFGLKIVPVVSKPPSDWRGISGHVTSDILRQEVPDITKQIVYVSGPEAMVESLSETLNQMGVSRENIHQDFFPGYTVEIAEGK